MEHWRPIAGFEGIYEVSDSGRVKSLERVVQRSNGRPQFWRLRILSAAPDGGGYLQVCLRIAGQQITRKVHLLVLETFIGPRPKGFEGCHGDGIKTNNFLDNLRWATPSENELDKLKHGTHYSASKTCCPQGHAYDGKRFRADGSSYRYCLECDKIKARRHRERTVT